jgi:hypothetical protein
MILIELTAAINALGTLKTFYQADAAFVTSPTDSPANVAFGTRVIDPGSIGLHAFSDGRTGGVTKLETGEIVLANVDGALDHWLNYSFEGRPVVIRAGSGGAYPASFSTLFVGTVDGIDVTATELIIRLRDKQYLFDIPVRTSLYGGTNLLPAGVDGLATDLKGKARPAAFGKVFNVSPPQVNTSLLVFEVGPCYAVDAVYSNGAVLALAPYVDYTSLADMMANPPAAGYYRAWPAGGYFRIGNYDAQQITADVTEGATAAERTVAQILKRLALAAGVPSGDISLPDIAVLDALNPAVVGICISDDTSTFTAAMDEVAGSIGAWYGFDQAGVLRMGRLSEPTGSPVLTVRDYSLLSKLERRPPRDASGPAWSATVNHTKCYTTQTSGLAGSAASRAGFVGVERRSSNAADSSIKTQWLMAGKVEVDTLLTTTADGDAEAARLLAMHKVRRDLFDVSISVDLLAKHPVRIADVVSVQMDRYGMGAGRLFVVIGFALNLAGNTATLYLWG